MYRALYVAAGKRGKQMLVAASNCNNSTGRLYVTDRASKTSFLVDKGVDLCVYPNCCLRESRAHSSYGLFAANGTTVRTLICVWILAYGGSFHGDL